jgi:tRNA threonylcarbamoyladenosine biosynthesis protein TsaE
VNLAPPLVGHSSSAEETRDLGARIGRLLFPGDVVLLGGDLGAGKTTFTQGVARSLGVTEPVTSPTFVLLRSYDGLRMRLLHVDVYRLEHLHEIVDLGLPEMLEEGATAVVEWGELAAPVFLPDYLQVRIDFAEGDDDRRTLVLRSIGARWCARHAELGGAMGRGAAQGPALGQGRA